MIPRWLLNLTRGHGIGCMLLGCRHPYWHGKNYNRWHGKEYDRSA